jgi:hypothetical protein
VDRFIVQTRGNLNNQRAAQTALKVKAASYKFQDHFFNGDVTVDTKGFDGLKKRLTGGQVIAAATNGLAVSGSQAIAMAFLDQFDQLLAAVPGINSTNGAIYANSAILPRLRSAQRWAGGFDSVREDITGKRVLTYNGIPILDPGDNLAGARILPQTETQGTAVGTVSSVYAVRFGSSEADRAVTGLTNGGVMVDDLGLLQSQPVYRTRIEFYCGLAVFGGKAAARLTGVLAT